MVAEISNADDYLSGFRKTTITLEQRLDVCSTVGDLNEISSEISSLFESFATHCHLLTSYDARTSKDALDKLDELCRRNREKLDPRPKFSFRSKNARKRSEQTNRQNHEAETGISEIAHCVKETSTPEEQINGSEKRRGSQDGQGSGMKALALNRGALVKDHVNEIEVGYKTAAKIVCTREQIQSKDVVLTNLSGCGVYLLGSIAAIRAENLEDCDVFIGPVDGSVVLNKCTRCSIHGIGRQFRIHLSSKCDLFLATTSGPVIEDCTELRFAPFRVQYSTLQNDLKAVGMSFADVFNNNMWQDVKDFVWLRSDAPSPNWSLLPEENWPELITIEAPGDF